MTLDMDFEREQLTPRDFFIEELREMLARIERGHPCLFTEGEVNTEIERREDLARKVEFQRDKYPELSRGFH